MQRQTIKLVIGADGDAARYLQFVFEREPSVELTGVAHTMRDLVAAIEQTELDVVLLEEALATETALKDRLWQMKDKYPNLKVIVLNNSGSDETMFRLYREGADAVLDAKPSVVQIVDAVIGVYANNYSMPSEVCRKLIGELARLNQEQDYLLYAVRLVSLLTSSEFEVLRLVYDGFSYKEIAQQRHVEEVTIRSQANRILGKVEEKSIRQFTEKLKRMHVFDYLKNI